MWMVGSTTVYSVQELQALGYVALGYPVYNTDLECASQYWILDKPRLYAVTLHDVEACQTNSEGFTQIREGSAWVAIAVAEADLPEEVKKWTLIDLFVGSMCKV